MTVIVSGITLAVIFFFVEYFHSSIPECTSQYPLQEIYTILDENHTWEYSLSTSYRIQPTGTDIKSIGDIRKYDIRADYPKNLEFLKKYEPETFIEITSYSGTIEDGINITAISEYWKHLDRISNLIFINSIDNGNTHILQYAFEDEKLTSIHNYSKGIDISFHKNKPTIFEISNTDGTKRIIAPDIFYLRGIKRHNGNEIQEGWKDSTFLSGEKCIESVEENGINYWMVYNKTGEKLFKWPKNDDFCKARVYDDNKPVELPLYFDMNEFKKIERKINELSL